MKWHILGMPTNKLSNWLITHKQNSNIENHSQYLNETYAYKQVAILPLWAFWRQVHFSHDKHHNLNLLIIWQIICKFT